MYGVIIGGASALVFGLIVLLGPVTAALIVGAIVVVAVLALRPAWSLYAAILVGLTAYPAFIPYSVQAGSTTVFLFEPFLFVAALWAILTHPAPAIARRRIPLMAILLAAAAAAGFAQEFPTIEVISDGRGILSVILAALVASRVYGTPHARPTMRVLMVSLWISLGVTLAAAVLKFPVTGRAEAAALFLSTTGAGTSDSTRYLTAASQIAVLVASAALALLITQKATMRQVAPFLIPSFALSFLSFSRNSFLAILLAVAFAVLAARTMKPVTASIRLAFVIGVPLVILALANAAFGLPGGDFVVAQVNGFMSRVIGGLDSSTLADDTSAVARVNEDGYMLTAISQSPITGHGFGFAYRPAVGPAGSFSATKGQYYGHNFYLWIMVKAGILGLLAFLYFALTPIIKAFKLATPAAIGLGSATAGLMLALAFAPFLNDVVNGGSLAVGLLFGALMASVSAPAKDSSSLDVGAFVSANDERKLVR